MFKINEVLHERDIKISNMLYAKMMAFLLKNRRGAFAQHKLLSCFSAKDFVKTVRFNKSLTKDLVKLTVL